MSKTKLITEYADANGFADYKESLIWASGNYLGKVLPENYDEWGDEKLNNFLTENARGELGYREPDYIWETIITLASYFRLTVNNKLKGDDDE